MIFIFLFLKRLHFILMFRDDKTPVAI